MYQAVPNVLRVMKLEEQVYSFAIELNIAAKVTGEVT